MFQMTSTDIVIFMHDDIEFLKYGWGEEVVRLFNDNQEYGIIGVAGSAEFDDKAAWWQYKKIYGQVMHKSEGKVWLSAFSPLLKKDLEEVCVIDGLFMAVHNKRIIKRFDNDLKFPEWHSQKYFQSVWKSQPFPEKDNFESDKLILLLHPDSDLFLDVLDHLDWFLS